MNSGTRSLRMIWQDARNNFHGLISPFEKT
jgi:hypothetical protein